VSAKTSLFLDSGPESTFAQPSLFGDNSRTGQSGTADNHCRIRGGKVPRLGGFLTPGPLRPRPLGRRAEPGAMLNWLA
jgi:hypothetical protein